jgi:hypothetical protein
VSIAIPIWAMFLSQTIRKAFCLTLVNAGNKISSSSTGITIPAIAKPLPVILPPLFSIITRLIIPRTIANGAEMPKVNKLRILKMNAATAILLLFTITAGACFGFCSEAGCGSCVGVPVNDEPQELQNLASSGFSLPHFEHFIFSLSI